MFATRDIKPFTQILSDAPLILMKPTDDLPELYQQFTNLPKDDRDKYLALSYHADPNRDAMLKDKLLQRGFGKEGLQEMADVAGIMQTNAFNVDLNDGRGSRHRALFPNIARINHSCAPNAHVCFYPPNENRPQGRMVVHSLRHLQPGEEILVSYFSILLPRSERQTRTQKWGFKCFCPVCTGEEDAEILRKDIQAFNNEQIRLANRARATMKDIKSSIETGEALLEQISAIPELYPALPDLLEGLGMLEAKALFIQKREARRDNILAFLEQSAIWEARITGVESAATIRRLSKAAQFAGREDGERSGQISADESGRLEVQWTTS